jgi:hypothetical protein
VPVSLHFRLAYHARVRVPIVAAASVALSVPAPADRLHAATVLVAIDCDHPKVARSLVESALDDVQRIQRLIDGSEREGWLGRELLDELVSDLP